MKSYLLVNLLLFLWLAVSGCTILPSQSELIAANGIEGVIFSQAQAEEMGIQDWNRNLTGYWTPSQEDVLAFEKALPPYLREAVPQDYHGPLRGLSTYKRQYVGLLLKDQPVIFANFFCDTHDINWQQRWVQVMDGGSCYFEIKYDVQAGTFSDLLINGEA